MAYGKEKDSFGITTERDYKVYKKNDLIQKSRFSLTLNQQKTLLFLISKITDGTPPGNVFSISVNDYCKVSGINPVDGYYSIVKADLKAIADASVWVMQPTGKEALLRWLDIVRIDEGSGQIQVSFTKSIQPYLFFFTERGSYTAYPLLYVLPMSGKHSIRLYELLQSYANLKSACFKIEQLKVRLDAADEKTLDYKRFVDFRRYVIDRAIEEINQYTDIKVSYRQIKEGRKTAAVQFFIEKKNFYEKQDTRKVANKKLQEPRREKPKTLHTKQSIYDHAALLMKISTFCIQKHKKMTDEERAKLIESLEMIKEDCDNFQDVLMNEGYETEDKETTALKELSRLSSEMREILLQENGNG